MPAALQFESIDSMPETAGRRGPRESDCFNAYRAAKASPSRHIRVTAENGAQIERFYKSMIQWINRHGDKNAKVRKSGDEVYIWVADEVD